MKLVKLSFRCRSVYCCALKRKVMSDSGAVQNRRIRVADTKQVQQQWSNVIIL
jgi:hypothetical protein